MSHADSSEVKCHEWINHVLQRHPIVKTLMNSLKEQGCSLGRENFISESCSVNVRGGFDRERGIIVCHNHVQSASQVAYVITHELIHAFDECRSRIVWENCQHHACSEIRAANLSGECNFSQELARGQISTIAKHHQECVKRRAIASLAYNPNCENTQEATKAINEVFGTCFADTSPFLRIP